MPTYKGSYAVNLSALEAPSPGAQPVAVYYGRLEFTISSSSNTAGSMTGTLRTKAGKSYSVKSGMAIASNGDAIASDRQGQNNIGASPVRGTTIFAINFSLRVAPDGEVTLTGNNFAPGDANAIFFAENALRYLTFTGKLEDVPAWLGNYTMAIISPDPSGATVPAGAGYASLVVGKNGKLSFKGKLGDGSLLVGSANPAADGAYSLFVTPPGYAAGGYFTADIDVNARGQQAEPAVWNKAAKSADKAYPAGFSTSVDVIVQPWLVPAKKAYPIAASLGFGSSKNFAVEFSDEGLSDGDYTATLPDTVRLTGLGKLQAVAGGAGAPAENNNKEWDKVWGVKLNPLTGVFTGKVLLKHLEGAKTVVRNVPVEGALVLPESLSEDAPFAYGQYIVKPKAVESTKVSGLVTFVGPLEDNKAVATAGSYRVTIDEVEASDVISKTVGLPPNSQTTITEVVPPKRPAGSPVDDQIVQFTISEDLQSMVFNGQKLTLKSSGLLGLVYHKSVVNPRIGVPNGQFAVTISVDGTTGQVTNVAGFSQFVTITSASLSGSGTRTQNTVFQTKAPASSSIVKQD